MTKTLEELRTSQYHHELGQKICAAYIAQQQGITLNTALKKAEEPIGDLWLLLAEFARQGCAETAELERFRELIAAIPGLLM